MSNHEFSLLSNELLRFNLHSWYSLTYFKIVLYKFLT
jgi:hypothetical protein